MLAHIARISIALSGAIIAMSVSAVAQSPSPHSSTGPTFPNENSAELIAPDQDSPRTHAIDGASKGASVTIEQAARPPDQQLIGPQKGRRSEQ